MKKFHHYILFFFITVSIFSCTHKHEPLRYEKLNVDKQTKHLIDSTLAVIQQLSFTADTTFGQSTGEKHGKIDVQINCLDSVGCFASIIIADTSFRPTAYIFKIEKPSWTYVYSLTVGNWLSIELNDINFDKRKDYCFTTNYSCSRINSYYYCIDSKSFRLITEFLSYQLDFDNKKKEITLYTEDGNFGAREVQTYKWINGELKLIEQFDRTLTDMPFALDKMRYDDFKEYGFKIGDTVPGIMNAYLYEHYKLIGDSLRLVDSKKEAFTLEED